MVQIQRARDELAKELFSKEEALAAVELKLASAAVPHPAAGPSQPPTPAKAKVALEEGATVESLHRDLEILLNELDHERDDRIALEETLEAARAEAEKAAQELVMARKQLADWKRAAKGKGKAPKGQTEDDDTPEDQLRERIVALKVSRDKLIAALDEQSAESERLALENSALADVGTT
jgi:small-conductance mechanosensitive channel